MDAEQHCVQTKQIKLIAHLFTQEIYQTLTYVNGMETHVKMLLGQQYWIHKIVIIIRLELINGLLMEEDVHPV